METRTGMFSRLQIRTKVALVMTLLLALISLAIFVYFPRKLQRQMLTAVTEKAGAIADMTAFSVAPALRDHDRVGTAEALIGLRRNPDLVYFLLRDDAGRTFASFNEPIATNSRVEATDRRQASRPLIATIGTPSETAGAFSADGRVYQTSTLVRHQGKPIGTLVIGFSLDRTLSAAARSRAIVALVILVVFGAGVVAIFALSTLITGPLKRIVRVTERIAEGALSTRAEVLNGDEVGHLARSFNLMLDRLDSARTQLEELNRTLESRVEERARALRASEEQYRRLFDRNLAGVYIARTDGTIVDCNDACARLFGYDSKEAFLAQAGSVTYMHPQDRECIVERLHRDGVVMNEEVELRGQEGESVWALENIRLVPSPEGGGPTLEGILLDVTDRKRAEEDIAYKAYHDLLTGLPNRTLFLDRLGIALERAEREEQSVTVIFFDLDELKTINDTLGHSMGDTLLKMIASRLEAALQPGNTVARIGGDEFALLLTDIGSEREAEVAARNVLATIRRPCLVDDDELHVTGSVGVALYPADGATPEALIQSADGAMYRVKGSGGNDVELCSRLAAPMLGRMRLEDELRAAIERDEFIVLYQPQVSISGRRLLGVEALVRWRHPERSIVEPVEFISAAEHSGLIAAIGEIVLRKACAQAVAWRRAGFLPPRLSVNVSPRQLYQRNFAGVVENILAESGLDGAFLELELTEGMSMQNSDRSIRMLKRLRDSGISIAVDDFGTGQSSLSYLKRFPVDTVKVDKSFVADLTRKANDQSIVRAVLLVANQLGLRTIAEGVETEDQCDFLRAHGCGEIQGYLVSRPITASDLQQRFLEKGPLFSPAPKGPNVSPVVPRPISSPADPA